MPLVRKRNAIILQWQIGPFNILTSWRVPKTSTSIRQVLDLRCVLKTPETRVWSPTSISVRREARRDFNCAWMMRCRLSSTVSGSSGSISFKAPLSNALSEVVWPNWIHSTWRCVVRCSVWIERRTMASPATVCLARCPSTSDGAWSTSEDVSLIYLSRQRFVCNEWT